MSAPPTLRAISRARFNIAQYALATAILAEFVAATAGVAAGLHGKWAGALTLTVVLLAIIARGCRQVSASQTASANELLSALDFGDGLGRPVPREKRADWVAGTSRTVAALARRQGDEKYFASDEPISPRRLIENVKESAWWSKTLASELASLSSAVGTVLILTGLFLLLAPVVGVVEVQTVSSTAPWILAFILFLISQGPWGLAQQYTAFARGAEKIQNAAVSLLEKPNTTETDAVELSLNYHLTRQGAPVIPSWWHSYRQEALNNAWRVSKASDHLVTSAVVQEG